MIPSVVPLAEIQALLSCIDTFAAAGQDAWTTDRQDGFSDRYLWPKHLWMRDFCGANLIKNLRHFRKIESSHRSPIFPQK